MARSAALNPASMPFFPGGLRGSDDERGNGVGFGQQVFREHDRSSFSSHSVSPSDYRSVRSSPSPPQGRVQDPRHQPSPGPRDNQRQSPNIRQTDAGKPYPAIETRPIREGSILGTLDTLPEREDTQSPEQEDEDQAPESGHQTPGSSFYSLQQQQGRERLPTLPFTLNHPTGSISGVPYTSASPVSSHDSNSRATPAMDPLAQNFESQLKSSPMVHDILDRLVRCEYTTREIQRDLGDINRKVNLLVERALGVNSQPEFKDPFASNSASSFNRSRPSIGNIAPNQAANTDDITSISQRLNTLTSSVGQLLALQTQQMQQTNVSDGRNNSVISLNTPQMELAPNQILSPSGMSNNTGMLGHGLPNRPDLRPAPRHPNPPMRTWSAGNLDLPVRPSDQGLGRQEGILRDKRRSVSGLLRRDSSGIIDPQAENWAGGSRDNGPMVSKWEQLALAPELLRSLGKFGVGPPNKIQQRALPFLLRGADIIAQAPPTQERIAAYVIPAIQVAVTNMGTRPNRGPIVIMVSTTVDQATQAQRMIRDLGGPIGVKSALGVGTTTAGNDLTQELRLLQQNMPHIICGTPQKLHALFTSPGGLAGSEVRFLVLDEVDQLIARNLHEFVFNIVKLLPPPRSRPLPTSTPTVTSPTPGLPGPSSQTTFTSPFEPGNPIIPPFQVSNSGRRFSAAVSSPSPVDPTTPTPTSSQPIERQTALFSNTVPQDVLNLASAIQLREPVRVLVRRDGNVANPEASQGSRGLRQFYLYLAFTAGGRSDPMASTAGGGLGIIGSGRSASSAETTQAREWKLDALADIFDDVEVTQAIVYVGGMTALDSVVYKLASRGLEAIPLHGDMNSVTRGTALNKFRTSSSVVVRQPSAKVLVVYDVQLKSNEVPHVPLVINYDLPKAVEEYSNRVSSAIASAYSRAGVVVNFVTATGGDVEMLRSIECYYKIKCPEVPMSLRDIV
ncbi:hypothetical protein GALMADRAFT_236195 [Galerina marginata CBS 339.88]|uniref:RNA helicase n=1 Tax=Galerina marginata (strain CBS 339.88) TaxID=685588 RepID=A0A067TV35_GALM3|nr:hypothetical protein GALMADRAFT_236195 [Galerina marginata CBS 339.88]